MFDHCICRQRAHRNEQGAHVAARNCGRPRWPCLAGFWWGRWCAPTRRRQLWWWCFRFCFLDPQGQTQRQSKEEGNCDCGNTASQQEAEAQINAPYLIAMWCLPMFKHWLLRNLVECLNKYTQCLKATLPNVWTLEFQCLNIGISMFKHYFARFWVWNPKIASYFFKH